MLHTSHELPIVAEEDIARGENPSVNAAETAIDTIIGSAMDNEILFSNPALTWENEEIPKDGADDLANNLLTYALFGKINTAIGSIALDSDKSFL